MKPNIHPQYREVAFTDMSIGKTFIIRSTADARDTIEIDGVTYRRLSLIPPANLILSTLALRHVSSKPAALKNSVRNSLLSLLPLTLLLKLPRLLRLKNNFSVSY